MTDTPRRDEAPDMSQRLVEIKTVGRACTEDIERGDATSARHRLFRIEMLCDSGLAELSVKDTFRFRIDPAIMQKIWDLGSVAKVHAQAFDNLLDEGDLWKAAAQLFKAKGLIDEAIRIWLSGCSGPLPTSRPRMPLRPGSIGSCGWCERGGTSGS